MAWEQVRVNLPRFVMSWIGKTTLNSCRLSLDPIQMPTYNRGQGFNQLILSNEITRDFANKIAALEVQRAKE